MHTVFRPAARRLFSIQPNVTLLAAARARSIATQSSIAFISRPAAATATSLRIQRRWNSDEANKSAVEKVEEAIAESAIKSVKEGAAIATTSATTADELVEAKAEAAVETEDSDRNVVRTIPHGQKATHDMALEPRETIFIGNLFFDITAQDLKFRMEAFGVVTDCVIIHDTRGLSKGFGYVTFESVDSATRAVTELNQQIFEGRRVIAQYAVSKPRSGLSRPKGSPSRSLYIGNLSYDLTDRELNDIFKAIRNVVEVRVAVDRVTGLPRGFAHADFLDIESAQAAMEVLNGMAPHGRRLRTDFSTSTSQRSAAEQIKREQEE